MYSLKSRVNKLYRLIKQKIGSVKQVLFFVKTDDGLVDATSKQPAEPSQEPGTLAVTFRTITPERHKEIRKQIEEGYIQ